MSYMPWTDLKQDYRRKLQEEDNSNAAQRGNCACELCFGKLASSQSSLCPLF